MKKRLISGVAIFAVFFSLLLISSCNKEKINSSKEDESSQTEPFYSQPPVLDFSVKDVFSKQLIESEMSTEFDEPVITEDVIEQEVIIRYYSKENYLEYSIKKGTLEDYRKDIEDAEGFENAPNLGDEAKWNKEHGILFYYAKQYIQSVVVEFEDISESQKLTHARSLANAVIEKLD